MLSDKQKKAGKLCIITIKLLLWETACIKSYKFDHSYFAVNHMILYPHIQIYLNSAYMYYIIYYHFS